MTWDSKLIKKAEEIIKLYPQKRSALGPLLYLAQNKEGYIDDDSVVEISNLLGITEVQVRSVASFYTMYKQEPTGKYLLSVCKSISCEINNSKEVIGGIKEFTGLSSNECRCFILDDTKLSKNQGSTPWIIPATTSTDKIPLILQANLKCFQ